MTDERDEQAIADLRGAIEVLQRDGWTFGVYHEIHPDRSKSEVRPCHCVQGALATAITSKLWAEPDNEDASYPQRRWDRANLALVYAIAYHYGQLHPTWTSDQWNDEAAEGVHEVIAMLENAIALIEAGKAPWHPVVRP